LQSESLPVQKPEKSDFAAKEIQLSPLKGKKKSSILKSFRNSECMEENLGQNIMDIEMPEKRTKCLRRVLRRQAAYEDLSELYVNEELGSMSILSPECPAIMSTET
jgi:hypothetical protein